MTKARDIASAIPAPSTVDATELGYLDGVTSAIQTQLDAKTAKSTLTTTGDIYYASAANTPARLAIGSTSNVLTVAGGIPSWAAPASGSTFSGVSVDRTGTQSLANNTTVTLQFNAENFDTDAYHSTSVNNTRLTIPAGKAGYYQCNGNVHFTGNANGTRTVSIINTGSGGGIDARSSNCGTSQMWVNISGIVYAAVGDYFTITAEHDSGSTLDTEYSVFSIGLIGA